MGKVYKPWEVVLGVRNIFGQNKKRNKTPGEEYEDTSNRYMNRAISLMEDAFDSSSKASSSSLGRRFIERNRKKEESAKKYIQAGDLFFKLADHYSRGGESYRKIQPIIETGVSCYQKASILSNKENRVLHEDNKKAFDFYFQLGNFYASQAPKTFPLPVSARDIHSMYNSAISYAKLYKGYSEDKEKAKIALKEANAFFRGDSLEMRISPFLAITSFILALLFSVSSLTGYSVANVTTENFRIGGAIFFLIGMVFTFIYRLRRNKQF